jgi:hypothetical protein
MTNTVGDGPADHGCAHRVCYFIKCALQVTALQIANEQEAAAAAEEVAQMEACQGADKRLLMVGWTVGASCICSCKRGLRSWERDLPNKRLPMVELIARHLCG